MLVIHDDNGLETSLLLSFGIEGRSVQVVIYRISLVVSQGGGGVRKMCFNYLSEGCSEGSKGKKLGVKRQKVGFLPKGNFKKKGFYNCATQSNE